VSSRFDSHTKEEASTPEVFRDREKELEKQMDEALNQYRPMVPQGKEWRIKTSSQPAPVRPVDGSVRPVTPVRSVEVDGQTDDPEMPLGFSSSVTMVCDDTSDPAPEDDEELIDYSSSPERMNLDINVIICLWTVMCSQRRTSRISTLGQRKQFSKSLKLLKII
jgi:hypothetical protein